MIQTAEAIDPRRAVDLHGLFRARAECSPGSVAYRYHDAPSSTWCELSWRTVAREVGRWRCALRNEGLARGDRVGLMLPNGPDWVVFDQAALSMGLVTVPLYTNDRADNIAYVTADAGIRLLVVQGGQHWRSLYRDLGALAGVMRIVFREDPGPEARSSETRLIPLASWLSSDRDEADAKPADPDDLATLIYTSGTTGRPKGVMLSHRNILDNAYAAARSFPQLSGQTFLSFLPLSHSLERTGGYYLPMMGGATVAFARSISHLAEDLRTVRPSVLISVPRVYEMFYNRVLARLGERGPVSRGLFHLALKVGWTRFERVQGRVAWSPGLLLWPLLSRLVAAPVLDHLGGRIRFAVSGGAALPPEVSRFFLSLGLPLLQGYGMTESSPVVSVNRLDDNQPESIGTVMPGIEVRIGEQNELLTRSSSVMQGYWNNPKATAAAVDSEGWLHTGDQARIDARGHLYVTGRLKDIIVLGNGEKVPPGDMEMAILGDPLFDQVMLVGEGRAFLALLAVLNPEGWRQLAAALGVDPEDAGALRGRGVRSAVLSRVTDRLGAFPGYAQVRQVEAVLEPWTIEQGLLTPTLKLRRTQVQARFADRIEALYSGYR